MTTGIDQISADDADERLLVFEAGRKQIIAGFILALLGAVASAALIVLPLRGAHSAHWNLPFNVKQGWCWLAVIVMCLLGLLAAVGSWLLAVYSKRLISGRVQLSARGLTYLSHRPPEDVPCSDFVEIQEKILYQRLPIGKVPAKHLMPKVSSTIYRVTTTSGKKYRFDGDSMKEINRFGEILRGLAGRLSLPWTTVEEHG